MNTPPSQNHIADFFSYFGGPAVILAVTLQVIPALAALGAFAWYVLKIYESVTVQRWLATRQQRRLARMKAAVLLLEAKSVPMPPDMTHPNGD